jgi:hypothetical protein
MIMVKGSKRSTKPKTSEKRGSGKKETGPQLKTLEQHGSKSSADAQSQAALRILGIDDRESYLLLRQALDSFYVRAVSYYADGQDSQDRTQRQKNVKLYVDSFRKEVLGEITADIDCPPGTRECPGGDCVPINLPCIH